MTADPLAFLGRPVATRREFLARRVSADLDRAVGGREIRAWDTFFVDCAGPPDAADIARMGRLLDAEPVPGDLGPGRDGQVFLVLPRLGTVSPWSSKATPIFHRCGLQGVNRVECGRLVRVSGAETLPDRETFLSAVHDRMTQTTLQGDAVPGWREMFREPEPAEDPGVRAEDLDQANREFALALSPAEIGYLRDRHRELGRDPTMAELLMFAQANSEHCRHKIFNAGWEVGGAPLDGSLFDRVRSTHGAIPDNTLVAYTDNAAVIRGAHSPGTGLVAGPDGRYFRATGTAHLVAKAETHNHPTAISPHAGAATGAGGEIRDEAATGRGAESVAGLCGFVVSDLRLPGAVQPWEADRPNFPAHVATPLEIMVHGPLGAADFNNEFGRPSVCGFFRTLEEDGRDGGARTGYHKPVMLAAGIGEIAADQVEKAHPRPGDLLAQIGGPGMRIGIGGGSASSLGGGGRPAELDFNSVQRDNPEMQRRVQEVVNRCRESGGRNPIRWVHDVGAGGVANAAVEMAAASGCGLDIALDRIPVADRSMSPAQVWCNEAQERMLLAVAPGDWGRLETICARERCPLARLGEFTENGRIALRSGAGARAVDIPVGMVIGGPPPMSREAVLPEPDPGERADFGGADLGALAHGTLRHPAVASRHFLVTIGDRSVGGRVARDQMVGRFQAPVADCAIVLAGHGGSAGSAIACGERPGIAMRSPAASARMAVGEALTNLAASGGIADLSRVKLSMNWMADCGTPGRDGELVDAVRGIAEGFCQRLRLSIPVGKDSLGMSMGWTDHGTEFRVGSPVTAVATAFAPVDDVRKAWDPCLAPDPGGDTVLVLVEPSHDRRMGGSVFSRVAGIPGDPAPDADAGTLGPFLAALADLHRSGTVLAYHDRSDGGMFAAVCEMAFASGVGATLVMDSLCQASLGLDVFGREMSPDACAPGGRDRVARELFNEELGAVVQVARADAGKLLGTFRRHGLATHAQAVGWPTVERSVRVVRNEVALVDETVADLWDSWCAVSLAIQRLRDDPECAGEEFPGGGPRGDGLFARVHWEEQPSAAPAAVGAARPRVAVLREQGTNGHREMAAAFDRAGFAAHDVHMSDLESDPGLLGKFAGLAACGGFSFGDALGAGRGQALSVLENPPVRDAFAAFFARPGTFALGVCNGCQTLALLSPLMGLEDGFSFPRFVRNRSGRFEARFSLVEVLDSPSVLLQGMAGGVVPVVSSHGEGRVSWDGIEGRAPEALRFVDSAGVAAARYPENPNGSAGGVTGFSTPDGRVTILMPHPERVFLAAQNSWLPPGWEVHGPWFRMFANAREWVG